MLLTNLFRSLPVKGYVIIGILLLLNGALLWQNDSLKKHNKKFNIEVSEQIQDCQKLNLHIIKKVLRMRKVEFLKDSLNNYVIYRIPSSNCSSCINEKLIKLNSFPPEILDNIVILSHYKNMSDIISLKNTVLCKVINIPDIFFSPDEENGTYFYKFTNGMLCFPILFDNVTIEIIEQYLKPVYFCNVESEHVCTHLH